MFLIGWQDCSYNVVWFFDFILPLFISTKYRVHFFLNYFSTFFPLPQLYLLFLIQELLVLTVVLCQLLFLPSLSSEAKMILKCFCIKMFLFCMFCFFIRLCTTCVPDTCGGPKWASVALDLDFQIVIDHNVGDGMWTPVVYKSNKYS